MAAVNRRSWSLLRGRFSARAPKNRKRPVEAAGAVDAKNAPTAPWKTGRPVFHSYHRLVLLALVTGKVSPMFPVNFVTYVPGCTWSNGVLIRTPYCRVRDLVISATRRATRPHTRRP